MCACTIIQFAISKFLVSRAFMYEIESIHFNFHMLFYTCTGAAEETHVEDSVYKTKDLVSFLHLQAVTRVAHAISQFIR